MTMRALVAELESFVTRCIRQRTAADPGQRVQLALVGPPDTVLDQVYTDFTRGGDTFAVPGGPASVYTLLLEGPGARPTVPTAWWTNAATGTTQSRSATASTRP